LDGRGFIIVFATAKEGEHSCEPSAADEQAGPCLAVEYLRDRGVVPSSKRWHRGLWYSTVDQLHYHPRNWSEAEERLIFTRLTSRK
jgi:hypothetical protein